MRAVETFNQKVLSGDLRDEIKTLIGRDQLAQVEIEIID